MTKRAAFHLSEILTSRPLLSSAYISAMKNAFIIIIISLEPESPLYPIASLHTYNNKTIVVPNVAQTLKTMYTT